MFNYSHLYIGILKHKLFFVVIYNNESYQRKTDY
jgi:hypothetical protein